MTLQLTVDESRFEKFSVCQFFEDGSYEYVRRFVALDQAVVAARHYMTSVGAQMGTTTRVIITDTGDCIVFEWTKKDGIVFPPKEQR